MITSQDTLLFQGDSITDCGRTRERKPANDPDALGFGYARYAAASLLVDQPGIKIYNRGVSGNRVTNLVDRWEADCLALEPTVISILIGVNDTWHGVAKGTPENGVPLKKYDQTYRELITSTREALPGVKIILCQPFVTECGAVAELNFHPDIDERRSLVDAIASEHADAYVKFQAVYDEAVKRAEPAYWAADGVHPTLAGHMLMAQAWIDAVQTDSNG
jgi:lysophospholipase L1-like esterase